MSHKELMSKVALLKSGLIVEISGDTFVAERLSDGCNASPCEVCDLDSICRDDVFNVCCEMETLGSNKWLLRLAHHP